MSARNRGAGKWAIRAAGIVAAIGIARGDGVVDEAHEIRVLSGRPDMVTAGNALIGISNLDRPPERWHFRRNCATLRAPRPWDSNARTSGKERHP